MGGTGEPRAHSKSISSSQQARAHSKSKKSSSSKSLYNVSNITSKPKCNTRDSRRAAQHGATKAAPAEPRAYIT